MNNGQGHRSQNGCFAAADLVKVHFVAKWKYTNIKLVPLRTTRAETHHPRYQSLVSAWGLNWEHGFTTQKPMLKIISVQVGL